MLDTDITIFITFGNKFILYSLVGLIFILLNRIAYKNAYKMQKKHKLRHLKVVNSGKNEGMTQKL